MRGLCEGLYYLLNGMDLRIGISMDLKCDYNLLRYGPSGLLLQV